MPRVNGYNVEIVEGWYDPDDDSMGDGKPFSSRPNSRVAFHASIANKWYHEKTLGPFDTHDAALKAAKKWTAEQNKHRVVR